jgi:hypothetical protein
MDEDGVEDEELHMFSMSATKREHAVAADHDPREIGFSATEKAPCRP